MSTALRNAAALVTLVVTLVLSAAAQIPSQLQPDFPGQWTWPTGKPVRVTRAFDPPDKPWLSGHRGVDLDIPPGTEILSPAPGQVIYAGTVVNRGVVSVMHAGGLRSTYEPVDSAVVTGQVVSAGDLIGTLSETSDSYSHPGLHWGARFGKDEYIDPLRMLLGPSVLKPWD